MGPAEGANLKCKLQDKPVVYLQPGWQSAAVGSNPFELRFGIVVRTNFWWVQIPHRHTVQDNPFRGILTNTPARAVLVGSNNHNTAGKSTDAYGAMRGFPSGACRMRILQAPQRDRYQQSDRSERWRQGGHLLRRALFIYISDGLGPKHLYIFIYIYI